MQNWRESEQRDHGGMVEGVGWTGEQQNVHSTIARSLARPPIDHGHRNSWGWSTGI
jgi:hypothetical protein